MQPAAALNRAAAATPANPPIRIRAGGAVRSIEEGADFSSIPGVARPRAIDRLVGGTVHVPISFDGAATPTESGAFPLYTRAADKIDAAIAVSVGRAIDVRG